MRIMTILAVLCLFFLFGAFVKAETVSDNQFSRITHLKKLYPQTAISLEGKPAAFIAPGHSGKQMQLAEELQTAIQQHTGVTIPIVAAAEFVDEEWNIDFNRVGSSNIIALGNVNNNILLKVLYGERYVVADSIYPGKGGYLIRTVHDPFAVGINVLALAGSDNEGVKKAIAVFIRDFVSKSGKNLLMEEPVIQVDFEKKAYRFFPDATHYLSSKRQPQYTGTEWFRKQLKSSGFMNDADEIVSNTGKGGTLVSITGHLARMGQTYFRTGNRELLPLMKQLVDRNMHLLSRPAKLEGMGGRSAGHVREWDLLEELSIWTDDERLAIANALLADAMIGHERRSFHKQVREGAKQAMDENHGTSSALNSFRAWQYFHKYYDIPESDYWMRCAQAVFSAQASTYQILEDASGYLCYCSMGSMDYSLGSHDLTYFKRDIASHHAKYVALACTNNLGLSTGFGDTPSIVSPGFFELIAPAAWFYRDPHLNWIMQNWLPQSCGLRIFQKSIAVDLEVKPREPVEWSGVIRWPLYDAPLTKGDSTKEPVFAPRKDLGFPLFNKIIFKENWSQEGQYLLLDGAGVWSGPPGPHGHKHNDINTIINFTALGRMWLVDHTYQMRAFQDHSGVLFMREGSGGFRKRTLAELLDLAEYESFGMSRSRFMDWERCIFWNKGRYFLILDKVTAQEDGEHFARAAFRTLGEAVLKNSTLRLSQDGKFCEIVSDDQAVLDLETYQFTSEQWEQFYPYARPVCTILHEDKKRYLKKGESITFLNMLYPYAEAQKHSDTKMEVVSENSALITGSGEDEALMGIGEIPEGLGECSMFILSPGEIFMAGFRSLLDNVISADTPCNLSIDLAQKELTVDGRDGATLSFADGKEMNLEDAEKRVINIAEWPELKLISEKLETALSQSRDMASKRADSLDQSSQEKSSSKDLKAEEIIADVTVKTILKADINGDSQEELLLGTDQGLGVYNSDGSELWKFETGKPVRAIDTGDVNKDNHVEIVIGCDNERVYLLNNSGHKLWDFKCKPCEDSLSGPPAVDFVKIDDLDADGNMEIIVGANWIHVLNADGGVKWEHYMEYRRGRITGDFVCGTVADLNGDGQKEIAASFSTSYPMIQILNAAGERIDKGSGGGSNLTIDVPVDIATTGIQEDERYIASLDKRQLQFYSYNRAETVGRIARSFVQMYIHQPDASKLPMIVAATSTCDLFLITLRPGDENEPMKLNSEWLTNLGEKVTALLVKDSEIYAGTKNGGLHAFSLSERKETGYARIFNTPVSVLSKIDNRLLIAGHGVWRSE